MEGSPALQSPAEASFADLPPALLGKIFVLTGSAAEIGPVVTLVCSAWHAAFYAEPLLWHTFKVSPSRWPHSSAQLVARAAAHRPLLQRVAHVVSAFEVRSGDQFNDALAQAGVPWSLADLCGLLQPPKLVRLSLQLWHTMPPGLLATFPSLHTLELAHCGCGREQVWPHDLLDSICCMQQLTQLAVTAAVPPPHLLAALADWLPQLRHFAVSSWSPLQHAERLTRLTALQHLALAEHGMHDGCLQPPAPEQFVSLQTYLFQRAGTSSGCIKLPGAQLNAATFGQDARGQSLSGSLCLAGIRQLPSLPALLAATVPPAGGPLRALRLEGQMYIEAEAAAIPAGSAAAQQLAQLQELHLQHGWWSSAVPVLEALLPHAAHALTCLELRGGLQGQLPQCVVGLRGLRRLALPNNYLADLPGGPYLSQLEHLDLLNNRLTALPPALTAATALTCLVLSINTSLRLSDAEVDGILLRMPRLAVLHADNTDIHPVVLERLHQARPLLSIQ